jgi:3-phenylpropionate/trans-cinnamate dioxygenase ferredoxin reductase subunit
MTDRHVDHLLVGGGIAAASCAAELDAAGAEGSILLVGRELDPPYHRPPLSKEYLRGDAGKEALAIEVPARVEVLTRTSVMEIDAAAKTATLSTKEVVGFGTALVATGAMVRRINVDGSDLEGIHYLRAPGNADAIRRDAADAERVVLVGGSFIGCEVAATLAAQGKPCAIVMLESEPMERGFGRQVGAFVRRLLETRGVEVIGDAAVARFAGDERVGAVVLEDGREVPGQAVVCGTGALPDVMLARKSGLAIGERGGVLCDARLLSSAPGVYAAGDMCEYDSVLHGEVVRIEHEEVAAAHGRTVARNMLGAGEVHDTVPYFWSDLADWTTLEYVSTATSYEEEVVEGSLEDGAFAVRYLKGGALVAYLRAGGFGDLDAATAELRRR